jgi:hypothetical protein
MSILHRRRRVFEGQQARQRYTRDQLEAMSAAQVQAIAEGLGIVHQNKAASIAAILSHE